MLNTLRWYGRVMAGLFAVVALSWLLPTTARAYETTARAAILVEYETGQVLFAKNPDMPLPPASMSKLMTVFMLFERLRSGRLSLDDEFSVSEKAWRKGGSKMFVEVGKKVRVGDLLHGIIVQSGNDACIVVAENLAGTEEAFAEQATERAKQLGMTNTTLKNASGWPHPDHMMSVRDLAILAGTIIKQFPEYYGIFSEREYEFNGIVQYARNPLLRRDVGADGLKTGYTDAAGYSLTASAVRDGRRLILVVAGFETSGQRARGAERLLEHGFRDFDAYHLFEAGQVVDSADVWLGDLETVPLVAEEPVTLALTPEARRDLEVKVIYEGPIPAPIAMGSTVAQLEITAPGIEPRRVPLVAGEAVEPVGMLGRMTNAIGYLIWGRS
ncbi:MAG: D-alanyl-D-alanine carboxypeptidase family protein [Pseudomonadota bacterium]